VENAATRAPAFAPWRLQFSLGTMLLWVAILCLAIAYVMLHRELVAARRELATVQPLPVQEVARQFQEQTTLGGVTTTVTDVSYSPADNSFLVAFSWTNPASGQRFASDVRLTGDGYGRYFGQIGSSDYYSLLGGTKPRTVGVETPSLWEP